MRARVIGYIPLERESQKKTRISHLVDVTRSKSDSDRLKKLAAAAKIFNHNDKSKHDNDIKAGAVSILCNLLSSCSPFFIAKSKEVYLLCTILIQLFRCSEDKARVSFCLDGSTLITNLLEVIEINYRLGPKGDMKCLVLAQNLMEKLLSFACVPLAMIKHHDELVSSLVSNINGATGRIAMLISMKCLSMLSEHKQNKRVLLKHPGVIKSVEVGSRHMAEAVRDESARIVCNLAWDARNKAQLSQSKKQGWVELVFNALTDPNSSTIASKQYAIKSLTYIASEVDNKIMIVSFENGAIVKELVRLIGNPDGEVTIAAAELIGSLICRATATKLACCHPGLLMTLASLGCGNERVALPCARIVKKLSTYIRSDDSCHDDLLLALITLSYGSQTEVLKLTVKAYAAQAESPHNRLKMIAQKGLLSTLTMLTEDENYTVRDHALFVVSVLAADVAAAKGVTVDQVLEQVVANKSCRSRLKPRCYSPTTIMQFEFDFNSVDLV